MCGYGVQTYYDACNTADEAGLAAAFTPDATHYFTRLPAVSGAEQIATLWAAQQRRLDARWTVEHGLEAGDEAVIEWTMTWTEPTSVPCLRRRRNIHTATATEASPPMPPTTPPTMAPTGVLDDSDSPVSLGSGTPDPVAEGSELCAKGESVCMS